MFSARRFTGPVLFIAGAGCATAVVDEEPGSEATVNAIPTGSGGSGGTTTTGLGGMGMPGSGGTGAGGASVSSCPDPRTPEQPGAAQGNSGSFDTTEPVCYFVQGDFNTWSCSNIGGRTVTINGARSMCGAALPEKTDGGYYFEFGASTDGTNYTSFYWYTS